jgi:formylglycine-generating enzyme required for sulfatase activity
MAKDSTNYDNNQGDTTAVGSYQGDKSPYGLYDMSGNVSEWVADWYADDYYQNSPATNPTGPDDGLDKVVRGGAWNSLVWDIDLSNRQINVANYYLVVGFRCARDANP